MPSVRKRIVAACAAVLAVASILTGAAAAPADEPPATITGEADAAFTVRLRSELLDNGRPMPLFARGSVELPDGSIIVAAADVNNTWLIKVDRTGRVDNAFYDAVNGDGGFGYGRVTGLLLHDGGLYASGYFSSYHGAPVSGLVRLSLDGELDSTFQDNLTEGFTAPGSSTKSLVADGDGFIVYGDYFTIGGLAYPKFARVLNDGVVDQEFSARVHEQLQLGDRAAEVSSVVVEGDRIYVAGRELAAPASAPHGLVRLQRDGGIDTEFSQSFGFGAANGAAPAGVSALLVKGDDLYVGLGTDAVSFNDVAAKGVVRVSVAGRVDEDFARNASSGWSATSSVESIVDLGDHLVVAGVVPTSFIKALAPDGTSIEGVSEAIQPWIDGVISHMLLHSDGSVLVSLRGVGFGGRAPLMRLLPAADSATATVTLDAFDHQSNAGESVVGTLGLGVASDDTQLDYTVAGLPTGLIMTSSGTVRGVPIAVGDFEVTIIATHERRDAQAVRTFTWHVLDEQSAISVVSDPASSETPGTWDVVVTNTGRTALEGVAVTDTTATISCPATSLAAGQRMVCSATIAP